MGLRVAVVLVAAGVLQLVAGAVVLAYVFAGPAVAAAVGLLAGGLLSGALGLLANVSPDRGGGGA